MVGRQDALLVFYCVLLNSSNSHIPNVAQSMSTVGHLLAEPFKVLHPMGRWEGSAGMEALLHHFPPWDFVGVQNAGNNRVDQSILSKNDGTL